MTELASYEDGSERAEDNLPRRDASGYKLTDYTDSRLAPERQTALRRAELEYVNGIIVMEDGEEVRTWPTLQELGDRHKVPVKLINEASAKYKWSLRRQEHKLKLKIYETEKALKQRHVAVDKLTDSLVQNTLMLDHLNSHVIWEMSVKADAEKREYQRQLEAGNFDYIPNAGIRIPDLKGIADINDVVGKTRDRLVKQAIEEAQRLVEEPVAPEAMLTAVDEQKVKDAAAQLEREVKNQLREEGLGEIEVSEVWKELIRVQEINNQLAHETQLKMIQGELGEDDEDEDDDDEPTAS